MKQDWSGTLMILMTPATKDQRSPQYARSSKWAHIGLGCLFVSLWMSGPVALVKVMFGHDPWEYLHDNSASTRAVLQRVPDPQDRAWQLRFALQDEALRKRKVADVQVFAFLGGGLFLVSFGIFAYFGSNAQAGRGLHILGLCLCLAAIAWGVYTKDIPFDSPVFH